MKWPAAMLLALTGCAASASDTVQHDAETIDGGAVRSTRQVDFVIVLETTGSGNWLNYPLAATGIRAFAEGLLSPDDPANLERQATDLRVAVATADLGGPFTFCSAPSGDNATLNPARFGDAQRGRFGSEGVRYVNSPPNCAPVDTFPRWSSVGHTASSHSRFTDEIACGMNLGNFGCELSQPLETLLRAGTRELQRTAGSIEFESFIRPDAILVLAVLTAMDDVSVRECPDKGAQDSCDHAQNALIFSSFAPCTSMDTTTPLDRYHDSLTSQTGFLGLKPDHPERVLFAAFAGVPLGLGTQPDGRAPSWQQLLGSPGARGADDFCARETQNAFRGADAFGATSMRVRDREGACGSTVVPACRRFEPISHTSTCEGASLFRAFPARRLTEIARRFDESPVCAGQPCRNGMVFSVCENDYRPAMRALARRVRQRL